MVRFYPSPGSDDGPVYLITKQQPLCCQMLLLYPTRLRHRPWRRAGLIGCLSLFSFFAIYRLTNLRRFYVGFVL